MAALSTGLKDKGPFCGSLLWVITRTIGFAWQLNLLELGAMKVSFLPWSPGCLMEPWMPHGWTDGQAVVEYKSGRDQTVSFTLCVPTLHPAPACSSFKISVEKLHLFRAAGICNARADTTPGGG